MPLLHYKTNSYRNHRSIRITDGNLRYCFILNLLTRQIRTKMDSYLSNPLIMLLELYCALKLISQYRINELIIRFFLIEVRKVDCR
jgi:hypothetical protein